VPVQPVERKLAAIFAADIAGYSRLMARDEVGTLARLKACRAIVDDLINQHRGRIFNTAGGSVVADFASAADAVQCAVAVQAAMTTAGITTGDGAWLVVIQFSVPEVPSASTGTFALSSTTSTRSRGRFARSSKKASTAAKRLSTLSKPIIGKSI
jgi:hypothetical protein